MSCRYKSNRNDISWASVEIRPLIQSPLSDLITVSLLDESSMSTYKLTKTCFFLQVYKAWVNCCLGQLGDKRTINDLAEDLKDGVVLCQLIKLTTGHEFSQCQLQVSHSS